MGYSRTAYRIESMLYVPLPRMITNMPGTEARELPSWDVDAVAARCTIHGNQNACMNSVDLCAKCNNNVCNMQQSTAKKAHT